MFHIMLWSLNDILGVVLVPSSQCGVLATGHAIAVCQVSRGPSAHKILGARTHVTLVFAHD